MSNKGLDKKDLSNKESDIKEYDVKSGPAAAYARWCLEEGNTKVGRYVKKQAARWLCILESPEAENKTKALATENRGISHAAEPSEREAPGKGERGWDTDPPESRGEFKGRGSTERKVESSLQESDAGREAANSGAYVCPDTYEKICKLLKLMQHPDLGCQLYEGLEDYEWFLLTAVFCTFSADGRRLYRTAILEIARKNYKTFISAVIFIIAMLTSAPFSRFFSVAPDYKLSSELRLAIRKIVLVSPALREHFKITREQITCRLNDTEYTPLAYSNDRMDGKLAHMFLADEAGAMDSYPVEAMRSSQITLRDKLGIIISTQYPNDNNVFLDEIDIAKKLLDGLLDGEDCFALLYEPDTELTKEWETNDNVIYQSNPVSVQNPDVFDSIRKMRTMAVLYENKRENYLCKHNNIQYQGLGTEGYIDIEKVKLCRREPDDGFWRGKHVFIGVDLSLTTDNTAVCMVCEEDGVFYAKVWAFIPGDRVQEKTDRERVDYKKMIQNGVCFACGEEVIDYGFVEQFIMGLEEKYGVTIEQIGYDRMNAISTVQKLEAEGYECVMIKQHSSVLHSPTKLVREQVLSDRFRYDENRLLEINFQNARLTEDTNLNMYVNKKRSAGKVDMVVALINATYLLEQELLHGAKNFVFQIG